MPFYTERLPVTQPPADLAAEQLVVVDFKQAARRDVETIRRHALGAWAVRQSAIGEIGIRNEVLGLIAGLGAYTEVTPGEPAPYLDLRCWCRGRLPPGPRQCGHILIRDTGELAMSNLPVYEFGRTIHNQADVVRWWRGLFGNLPTTDDVEAS